VFALKKSLGSPVALHTTLFIGRFEYRILQVGTKFPLLEMSRSRLNAPSALKKIGYHHVSRLVVARVGFSTTSIHPIVGASEICVPVRATDLQATEFVDQEEVDHTATARLRTQPIAPSLRISMLIDHREGITWILATVRVRPARCAASIRSIVSFGSKPRRLSCTYRHRIFPFSGFPVPPALLRDNVVRSVALRIHSLSDVLRR